MTALQLPCTIFQTQHRMNDYGARDMRCGDLTAEQLKRQFHLEKISTQVDPYTLKNLRSSGPLQYALDDFYRNEETITAEQCARLLFDEFRRESHAFAFYGPYRHLIIEMINHMQYGDGAPFNRLLLDMAFRYRITDDKSDNSSLRIIKSTLKNNMDWTNRIYPATKIKILTTAIEGTRLPKFNRVRDIFNGMGISIHDTWATQILINRLDVTNHSFRAKIQYRSQDHFGLDDQDMASQIYNRIPALRIWFVLQHYRRFGFKPFMTNSDVTVEISGAAHETQP